MGEKKKSIKDEMYDEYGITEEDIDHLVMEQEIENQEEKIKILKELIKYKSFEDYVHDHEKEFDMVEISDDYRMIIISNDVYPDIDLDIIKKMGIIADHFGLLIYTVNPKDNCTTKKFDRFIRE